MSSTNKDGNSKTKAWFGRLSPCGGRRGCVFYVFLVGYIYPVVFFFLKKKNKSYPEMPLFPSSMEIGDECVFISSPPFLYVLDLPILFLFSGPIGNKI